MARGHGRIRELVALGLALALLGCEGDSASVEAPADMERLDAVAAPDAAAPADIGSPDAAPADAEPIVDAEIVDAVVDAGPTPRCSVPPATPPAPSAPLPADGPRHPGVDPIEAPAYARLRDALLGDPGVHFVATRDQARGVVVVEGGLPEARARVEFSRLDRADRSEWTVTAGELAAIFPRTAPDAIAGLDALTAAFENPGQVDLSMHDYAPGDPRVGYLPHDRQSWPDPLTRIGTLFDAVDAPDLVYEVWPWAKGGVGTHGGLSLLQSRSALVFSGRGARSGVVIDAAAQLVDAAPTIMAALAAPTTGGFGPDGAYDDGLYLTRQDGVVLWEALDPDPCVRPDHVVMILFDGLLSDELNHLALSDTPDAAAVEIPTLRALLREGAVYRHGAVVGYPSYSGPGHTTAGTGAWPGHHGVVGNAFYGRADGEVINPFAILGELPSFFAEPQRFWDFYRRLVAGGDAETLAEALHRAFDGTDEDVFVAVLNELTVGGADYTPLDHFGLGKASVEDNARIDALGQISAEALVGDPRNPVPTLLQISMIATDAAGENAGPHSPLLRASLVAIDARIAAIRRAYARREALDRTLFVLVSDHGMELQDPTRGNRASAAIRESGVATRHIGFGAVWLAQLELQLSREGDAVAARVVAYDDGQPVADAVIRCEGCGEVRTDAEGRARLPLAGPAAVTAEHPRFNPHTVELP